MNINGIDYGSHCLDLGRLDILSEMAWNILSVKKYSIWFFVGENHLTTHTFIKVDKRTKEIMVVVPRQRSLKSLLGSFVHPEEGWNVSLDSDILAN